MIYLYCPKVYFMVLYPLEEFCMNLEETRNALAKWFTNRFFKEMEEGKEEPDIILERYILGYIECGGLIDNDTIKLGFLEFKQVKEKFGINIESYGIRNYLTAYGDVADSHLSLLEALEFNKTLTVDDVRIMIARRFGLAITSPMYQLFEKLPLVTGFIECGGTLEDLVDTGKEEDKKIANDIIKFFNKIPEDYRVKYIRCLSNNKVKRSLIERLSNSQK